MDQLVLRTLARMAKVLGSIADDLATNATGPTTNDARMRRAGHRIRRLASDLDVVIDECLAHTGQSDPRRDVPGAKLP
jgi:hypothetical protein